MHIKAGSSVLACLLLVCVFVIRPSLQFSLVHKRQAEDWSGNIHTNTVSKGHAEGAGRREQPTSVHGKLASGDSADSTDALSHQGLADDTAGFPTPESSPLPASRLALRAQKTNIDNFPTSQRRRDEQTETRGAGKHRRTQRKEFQSDKSDLSRPNLLASRRRQVSARRKTPNTNSKHRSSSDSLGPDAQFIPEVVEVVEVVVDANSRIQPVDSRTSVSGGGGSVLPVYETSKNVALGSEAKRVALVPAAAVRSEALQQEVRQSDLDTHVPNMVLTAVGSVTALFGVCVMAAIFQCCCRKKRRNRLSGQDLLKNQKDEGAVSKRSRSKSPSPQKVPEIKEDKVERRYVYWRTPLKHLGCCIRDGEQNFTFTSFPWLYLQ
ncbi:hypothetical protein BaRGS_00002209 [Batillaria attramentaria]|uniref:Transmembrane protein n=1 Tax=Batillaria attramentaria TaxID=370345 RepID=A0ABD0M485_9CAEN